MDPITDLILNLFSLFFTAIQLGIPILILSMGLTFVFNKIQKRTQLKWISAATLTLFMSFFVFFFLLHTFNVGSGVAQTDLSGVPTDILNNPDFQAAQPSAFDFISSILVKSFVGGIVFTLLILPFAFAGVAVFDALKKKYRGVWTRYAIVSFLGGIAFIALLFFFPWIPVSLLYLVFFGI
ncbi:MAG: hypothetical protein AABY11_02215 [archaeon]